MAERADGPDSTYKVGRVLAEYGLSELHEELPDLWLGESGEAVSLRDLADRINVALVRQAMAEAGADPLEGEAENAYRLLTDDDVSAGVRTQQRNRLERAGVDVAGLESDFVTHQAVHTYLTDALGVSKEPDETDPIERHEERIQRLRSRTVAVMEDSLSDLQGEELSLGSFDTVVSLQVYCRDCETQHDLADLFREGGCDCDA